MAFLGTVPTRIGFWPAVWLQVAMGFSNVALPAGAESVVQVRFLQKQGLDLASALAVGGVLSTVSEFVVSLGLVLRSRSLLAPSKVDIGDVPVGSMAAVIADRRRRDRRRCSRWCSVCAASGEKVLPHVRQAGRTMWDAVRSPGRIALLIVGNVAAQALYVGSLLACLYAFGGHALVLDAARAEHRHLDDRRASCRCPVGDTAVSTLGMSGALVAIGVPEAVAAAAVLTNTVVIGYLPAIPGWFATNYLVRSGQPVTGRAAHLQVLMPPSTGMTAPVR